MRPTPNEFETYRDNVKDNYATLINVLNTTRANLMTLLNEKDPPKAENPSFIEAALSLAITIVAPEVWAFVKAKRLSEAAQALASDVEMVIGHLKAIPTAKDAVEKMVAAKTDPAPASATIGMMESMTAMYKRLEKEKALATMYFQGLAKLLPEKGKPVDELFAKTNWKKPPELLGNHVDDLVYVFMYALVREAVQRYGEIHVWVNKIWDGPSTDNIVLERKLLPFSETSTQWIFDNLNRGLDGKALPSSANMPGGPATNRIEPVSNWVLLATAWHPKVEIEAVEIGMTGDRERYRAFRKGERLHRIFLHLYKTGHGYVPRLNKFGDVEGYDDAVTAHIKKWKESSKK